jgi:hypothetical protein
MPWELDGNGNIGTGNWLGTRNNAPLIIRTENAGGTPTTGTEAMRITPAAQGRRVGIGTTAPQRRLHVEPSEIHSGGSGAGFSFGNRLVLGTGQPSPFTENPGNGERWVWYATERTARLWSGKDKIEINTDGNLISRNDVRAAGDMRAEGDMNVGNSLEVNGFLSAGAGLFVEGGNVDVSGDVNANRGVFGPSTGLGVRSTSSNFTGVLGVSQGVGGSSGQNIGVRGISDSDFAGVSGESVSPGNGFGVRGISTNTAGVLGVSTNDFGGFFTGPPSTTGSSGSLRLSGNVVKTQGEYSEALPHPDGSQRLLYAPLSPESWYEDFGRGELVEGRGRVEFDPDFAAILGIDDGHYHVFLTPEGDSNGLYVSSRSPTAFEVHEQQGGTSSLTFSYRVVVANKRKDGQPERLAKLEEPESMPEPGSLAARGIDFAHQEEEGLQ